MTTRSKPPTAGDAPTEQALPAADGAPILTNRPAVATTGATGTTGTGATGTGAAADTAASATGTTGTTGTVAAATTGATGAAGFDAAMRDRFERLADVLVPADGDMPAASTVGIAGDLLDKALRARPDLAEDCRRALAGCGELPDGEPPGGEPLGPETLEALADNDPEAFAAVLVLVLGGYYMSAEVKELLHYPGQQALRIDIGELPAYIEEGLLDAVIDRGPIYRRTPPEPESSPASQTSPEPPRPPASQTSPEPESPPTSRTSSTSPPPHAPQTPPIEPSS